MPWLVRRGDSRSSVSVEFMVKGKPAYLLGTFLKKTTSCPSGIPAWL